MMAQQEAEQNNTDPVLLEQLGDEQHSLLQSNDQYESDGPAAGIDYQKALEDLRLRAEATNAANYYSLDQKGQQNEVDLNQTGVNNAVEIIQRGNGNTYLGTIYGIENLVRVEQRGNHNRVVQDLAGDGMGLQVIQQGSQNELVQSETAGNAPSYQVTQKGHGIKLEITNGVAMPLAP
jgi:hypothetical protein